MMLMITIVAVLSLTLPYLLTTVSAYSICLSEGGLSSKDDKIIGATKYIQRRQVDGSFPKQTQMTSLNLVDKGGPEQANLSFYAYVRRQQSHYVHFKEMDPNRTELQNIQMGTNSRVIVDNCGNGLNIGTHL